MTYRERMKQDDMYAVVEACVAEEGCPFHGFKFQDDCFMFEYKGLFTKNSYRINMCEDYPVGTIKAVQSNRTGPQFATEQVDERVPIIFNDISRKIYRDMKVQCPEIEPDTESEEEKDEAGEEKMDAAAQQNNQSSSEEEDEDDEQYDYDYYEELERDVPEAEMHPLLVQDLETMKHKYGEQSVTYRNFATIGDIDVELHIPVDHFDPEIAKAWKITLGQPIIVRLHMNLTSYLDTTEPRIEVLQRDQKDSFGMGSQLRNVLKLFMEREWEGFSNSSMEKLSGAHKKKHKGLHREGAQGDSAVGGAAAADVEDPAAKYASDEDITAVMAMGFPSADMVRNALIIGRGHIEDALTLLIQHPEQCKGTAATHAARLPDIDLTTRSKQGPKKLFGKKSPSRSHHSSGSSSAPVPSSQNVKQMPEKDSGFMALVYEYCRQRLDTLNEFCVVCDEPHVFQNGATMLKPAVCGRDLCVFSFQTLGVMSDAAEDIATGPEVVDLLIAMGKAACSSQRKEVIFDPYPTVVDPSNPQCLAFSPKNKDYIRCQKAFDVLNMAQMNSLHGAELKKMVDSKDELAFPLLQWLIVSNRSHIVKLPRDKQLSFLHTPHQFLLMSSAPAKEAQFRKHKASHGSTFAFHGSHIENWHSILRQGLVNASGTKLQVNGAAYGKGIYLSPLANTSFSYSGASRRAAPSSSSSSSSSKNARFLNTASSSLTCIALCEVVTSPDLRKSNNIWVMPDPDKVCTRFFFVYDDHKTCDTNVDTQEHKYSAPILSAVKYQYH